MYGLNYTLCDSQDYTTACILKLLLIFFVYFICLVLCILLIILLWGDSKGRAEKQVKGDSSSTKNQKFKKINKN